MADSPRCVREDAALTTDAACALARYRASVDALAACCTSAGANAAFPVAAAAEALGAAIVALRSAPGGDAAAAAQRSAEDELSRALADAVPAAGRSAHAPDAHAAQRLELALHRAEDCRAATLAATLAPCV